MTTEHECTQSERLSRIEQGVNDAIVRLAVVDERIKAISDLYSEKLKKYDEHVVDGNTWRKMVIGVAISLIINIAGTIWWAAKVESNVDRLMSLHPYGTPVSPVYGSKA